MFPARGATLALSFEERVAAQRAIEEVYWRHRVWPAQNPAPKPPLSSVMPDAAIRARVEDYLRKSNALEAFWRRPVTGEQLQAEIDRIARDTRNPGMLREIYAALGNDARLVAETLVRASLADRLIRNWYAFDGRFHGDVKAGAEAALARLRDNAAPEGEYTQTTFRRKDETPGEAALATEAQERRSDVALGAEEWSEYKSRLGTRFGVKEAEIPIGIYSPLQEDADRFFAMAVLSRADDAVTVATVSWTKPSFEDWWSGESGGLGLEVPAGSSGFVLDLPLTDHCVDDTWERKWYGPAARSSHNAVWTGTEMIIWGGYSGAARNSSARYNPATDTWTETTTTGRAETYATAVWTGTEMIVWGGGYPGANTGGRYNPASDTWNPTSTGVGVPAPRTHHTAVWTGTEMIVWGGEYTRSDSDGSSIHYLNQGGRYDPVADTWTPTSPGLAPQGRSHHTAVWTGSEMVVWGGYGDVYAHPHGYVKNSGGRYNPANNSWLPTPTGAGVPSPRRGHSAVWTGSEMIVWGGRDDWSQIGTTTSTGGRYNPATNLWIATPIGTGVPSPRDAHSAIWTGTEMIVWGGSSGVSTGGRYNPTTDSWTPTSTGPDTPTGRSNHTAVWTGSEMIIWGGGGGQGFLNTGGRYSPTSDSWVPTAAVEGELSIGSPSDELVVWTGAEMIMWGGQASGRRYDPTRDRWSGISGTTGAPRARNGHTAVWTGTEMIVWGGGWNEWVSIPCSDCGPGTGLIERRLLNTGGRYDPVLDTWNPTSIAAGAPSARDFHTAVWTGTQMIIWGGADGTTSDSASGYYYVHTSADGARYDPSSDSWLPIASLGGPTTARYRHSAVWTGGEMIVWGGMNIHLDEWDGIPYGILLNTGGRYDPGTDTWSPVSAGAGVPSARNAPTAVWTGSEMIIWGGQGTNIGGRYDPAGDVWVPTSTGPGAPSARSDHTAIWTGAELIVWGGRTSAYGSSATNTGGRYDPLTDKWIPTSAGAGSPPPFDSHDAVWTGDRMIVWGDRREPEIYLYCARHNHPPIANAGIDRTIECESAGRSTVMLDGSLSSDPDSTPGAYDDIVRFEWIEGYGEPSELFIGEGKTLTTRLSLGLHLLTLRVTDAGGATATAPLQIIVADTIPPRLVVASDPTFLWPPNHDMRGVHVEARVIDACDSSPLIRLGSVTSSEPDDTDDPGDGLTTGDIQGASLGTTDLDLLLRAKRSGSGPGRTYTLRYEAADASGNIGSAATMVTVPHDSGTIK